MGVRGLQSFLKENRQSLCRSLVLDASGADARERVPVVVDAWGWVLVATDVNMITVTKR